MKNSWQILTILLAVALVVLSVKIVILDRPTGPAPEEMHHHRNNNKGMKKEIENIDHADIIYNNIMTRSSVRSYTSEPVSDEMIEKLLRAGMAAPTARNMQPWDLMVVNDRATLDKISTIIRGAHMAANAQVAILVMGTPAKASTPDYWIQDCSAVTENILLAAHGMGLGAVWCGAFPEDGSGKVEAMRELTGAPEGTYTLSVIVIGHPDSEPTIKDKWDPAKVHYNKF
ncbi:MAG: nitroreductase family protein [bacterium]